MNSQLYTAASGMLVQQRRLEMATNNLANLSTSGFRSQRSFSTVYEGFARGASSHPANRSVAVAGAYDIPGRGPLRSTGGPLDIALKDGDLLVVETAAGLRYTREGGLSISPQGELIDSRGNPVLSEKDEPIGGLTPSARIEPDGRVVDGEPGEIVLGTLHIVRDPLHILAREGDNLLSAGGRDADLQVVDAPELTPQTLEGSSTDVLQELVEMIDAQRAFEGYQRLVTTTINEVDRKAVNDIAG